jgi:hypothetical protein
MQNTSGYFPRQKATMGDLKTQEKTKNDFIVYFMMWKLTKPKFDLVIIDCV